MAQGLNNHQAGLLIGVNPTTGMRWRKGRSMDHTGKGRYYPPIHAEPVAISARCLSEEERILIGDLLAAGHSQRSVAVQLGRSPSIRSAAEIRRNISGAGNYRPFGAHRKALARRPRPRSGKLAHDNDLRDFVQSKLEQRWSPQQICHALPIEFSGQTERHLVQKGIYQALYVLRTR